MSLVLVAACSQSSMQVSKPDTALPDARDISVNADIPVPDDAPLPPEPAPDTALARPDLADTAADLATDTTGDTPWGPEASPDVAADKVPDILPDLASIPDAATELPADAGPDRGPDLQLAPDLAPDARDATVPDTATAQPDARDAQPIGKVTVVADSVLSSNATTIKSYDTNVNIASYRQHGILYYQGYQYVAWFNGNARNAIVARRPMDTSMNAGPWSWAYVNFTLSSDGDSHNVISMGLSPADGRLHLAIGQHGAQLYSIRTAGAATGSPWDNAMFGGTGTTSTGAASPVTGLPGYTAATDNVTYPYFLNAPDGTLQLAYRTGSSGDGEMQLAEYTGNWSSVGQFTSASGSYTQNNVTSTTRNAYPHGLDYDGSGRLHMAFTFRENLSTAFIANCGSTINNHDTLYVYSDDRGRTWKNNAGTTVADVKAGTTASIASPGLVIDPLPVGRDLMNQETQIPDHGNLIHAVISYVPDPYQPGCATDRTQAQPFHLWRAADGKWTKTQIRLGSQDVNQGYDRSKIFVDAADNAYVLLPNLRLVGATAASRWTDWQLLWDGSGRGNYGEAIIDRELSKAAGGVSVLYMKDTSSSTGELHVLDLKIGQ